MQVNLFITGNANDMKKDYFCFSFSKNDGKAGLAIDRSVRVPKFLNSPTFLNLRVFLSNRRIGGCSDQEL